MKDGWQPGRAPLIVAAIALAGLVVSFQGWRSRGPDFDVTPAIVRAVALVERGEIPRRGTLTDLNSYFPPGTTWIVAPAIPFFDDPRLIELFGSGLLYVLTLAGIFLTARRFFGEPAALLAVALYAASGHAVNLASWLWPRGHPVFYIWLVYFAERWVTKRQGWHAAAALAVWGFGLYVHFELTPAILILPALWSFYRAPIDWRATALAALALTVFWSPYLKFQVEREFVDIKSQLLLRPLAERGIERVPGCGEEPVATPMPLSLDSTPVTVADRSRTFTNLLTANFTTRVLAGDFVLWVLFVGGLAALARPGQSGGGMSWPVAALLFAFVVSVLVTQFVLRWWLPDDAAARWWVADLVRFQLLMAAALAITRMRPQLPTAASDPRILLIAIAAPLVALLVMTEEGGERRLIGVWPLQAIVIAAIVTAIAQTTSQWRAWALRFAVVLIAGANLYVLERVRDWPASGWAGRPSAPTLAEHYREIDCN